MTPKRLLRLAVAAIVAIAAALWLSTVREPGGTLGLGERLYPSLRERVNDVDAISVVKGDSATVTLRRADGGWTVEQRSGYLADLSKVRRLLLALAEAELLEQKTSRPENYPALGVEDPASGDATPTRLELAGIEPAVSLIVGKRGPGADSTYVRRSGETTSWLIDQALEVPGEPAAWLATEIVDIGAERIQSAAIEIAGGRSYSAAKPARTNTEFEVSGLTKGEELSSAGAASGFATALLALRLDDVRPVGELEEKWSAHAVYRTFDGLVLDLEGRRNGDEHYLSVHTEFDREQAERFQLPVASPPGDEAQESPPGDKAAGSTGESDLREPKLAETRTEADTIARRTQGWAYRIPSYKYDTIFKPLDGLLKTD